MISLDPIDGLVDEDTRHVSTTAAARMFGRAHGTVLLAIREGRLPAVKVRGRWMVDVDDLADLWEQVAPLPPVETYVVRVDDDGAAALRTAIDEHIADDLIAWALLWLGGLEHLYDTLTPEDP